MNIDEPQLCSLWALSLCTRVRQLKHTVHSVMHSHSQRFELAAKRRISSTNPTHTKPKAAALRQAEKQS